MLHLVVEHGLISFAEVKLLRHVLTRLLFDELVDLADVLCALKLSESIVLEDQDAFGLVLLLDLQGHLSVVERIEGLVDDAKASLAQLLDDFEPVVDHLWKYDI